MTNGTSNIPGGEAPEAPPAKPIGHLAIRGMIWTVGQSLGTKCITVLQQLLIARLFLKDEDFGLIAVAQVVISIASLGQSLGIGEILVRRHRRFARWVDAAFWLNLSGGLAGMLLTFCTIPVWNQAFLGVSRCFGGHVTEPPKIQGLLAIWAVWLPLDAMFTIFSARLRVDMRFRLIALLATIQQCGIAIVGLALAWMGLGAYSLVIPIPFMAGISVTIAWRMAHQRIALRPNSHRWAPILRDSRFFFLGSLFNILLQQGDYMFSSVFFSPALLGAYYFAYRMSTQTVQLIGANMTAVLLPSFSKIDDDESRRTLAYERTCSGLLLLGVPLCFLQGLLAEPAFHLLFGHKWDDALVPFQILSLSMAFTIPMTAAVSLLLSQGRYLFNLAWTAGMAIGFLIFVLAGAFCGSIVYVSGFVGLFFMLTGPLTVVMPVRKVGMAAFLWRVYSFPVLAGGIATVVGWALSMLVPGGGALETIAARAAGTLVVFIGAVALARPQSARDLAARVGGLFKR